MGKNGWIIRLAIVSVIFAVFMGCQKNQSMTENPAPPPAQVNGQPATPTGVAPQAGAKVKDGEKHDSAAQFQQALQEGEQVIVMYTCPTHHELKQDKPGKCPQCGEELIVVEESEGK